MNEGTDVRLERARALLAREGVAVRLSTAGAEGEILAVHAPFSMRETLAKLAPDVRSLGYRYVALDLDAGDS